MSYLGRYERAIARRPWPFIAVILIVTIAMMFFSTRVSFSAGEDSFSPSTEEGEANSWVREQYGTQANLVTVLFIADDNVLSRGNLDAMLVLEGEVLGSEAAEHLVATSSDPDGIGSPAEIVVVSRVVGALGAKLVPMYLEGGDGDGAVYAGGDAPPADTSAVEGAGGFDDLSGEGAAELAQQIANLSLEQKRTVLNGGNMSLDVSWFPAPLSLEFEPYEPELLNNILAASPLGEAFRYTVSTDLEPGEGYAEKALMSISLDPGLDPEGALKVQKVILELGEDVEGASEGLDVRVSGNELTNEKINQASGASTGILMMTAFILVFVILAIVYRDVRDTAFNFAALGMAILWVFGFIGMLGLEFNPALTAVPILLIGLGIDYGIHFNLRYREELRWGKDIPSAMSSTGRSVGFAILLSTVTTVVGFLSNAFSDIAAIRDFGILCAIGIISSFVIMVTFFPAVKVVSDRRRLAKGKPLVRPKKTRDRGWGWAADRMRGRIKAIREWNRKVRRRRGEKRARKGKKAGRSGVGRGKKWGRKPGGDGEGAGEPKHPADKPAPLMVCASGLDSVNLALGSGAAAARYPAAVLAVIALVTSISLFGAIQLEPRFDFRDFLPEGIEATETTEIILDDFEFSSSETVVVLAEGDVADPDVARAMEEVRAEAEGKGTKVPHQVVESPLRLARSLADPSSYPYDEDVASAWNSNLDRDGNGGLDEGITRGNVTAVYSALFAYDPEGASRLLHRTGGGGGGEADGGSGQGDGAPVGTEGEYRYDGAIVRIPVDTKGNTRVTEVAEDMTGAAEPLEELEGGPLENVVVTGSPILSAYTFESINEGQLLSILITLIASLVILSILYGVLRRSAVLGLVTIAPLLLVVIWTLGSMHFLGIPLSPVTVTIAAITVGLGIDYSIHMTQRFVEEVDRVKETDCALCVATSHTGTALFGSMATTALGFSVLIFALLPPLKQLGQVLALSVTFSFLAAVFVLPTFLRLWHKGRIAYLKRVKGIQPETFEGTCVMQEDGPEPEGRDGRDDDREGRHEGGDEKKEGAGEGVKGD